MVVVLVVVVVRCITKTGSRRATVDCPRDDQRRAHARARARSLGRSGTRLQPSCTSAASRNFRERASARDYSILLCLIFSALTHAGRLSREHKGVPA